MGFRTGAPAPDLGYNRTTDWPVAGSIAGSARLDGISAKGGIAAMLNLKGSATPGAPGTWHPTVVWMLGFVVVELIAFNLLSKYLNI